MSKFIVLVNCDESQEIVTNSIELKADWYEISPEGDLCLFVSGEGEVRRFTKDEWLNAWQE